MTGLALDSRIAWRLRCDVRGKEKNDAGGKLVDGRLVAAVALLAACGLGAERVGPDGNCFYRVVALHVYGSEAYHLRVRSEVCDYMEARKIVYAENFVRELLEDSTFASSGLASWDDALAWQRKSGHYNTETEIIACAAYLDRRIVVVGVDDNALGCRDVFFHDADERSQMQNGRPAAEIVGSLPASAIVAVYWPPVAAPGGGGAHHGPHYDAAPSVAWRKHFAVETLLPPVPVAAAHVAVAALAAAAACAAAVPAAALKAAAVPVLSFADALSVAPQPPAVTLPVPSSSVTLVTSLSVTAASSAAVDLPLSATSLAPPFIATASTAASPVAAEPAAPPSEADAAPPSADSEADLRIARVAKANAIKATRAERRKPQHKLLKFSKRFIRQHGGAVTIIHVTDGGQVTIRSRGEKNRHALRILQRAHPELLQTVTTAANDCNTAVASTTGAAVAQNVLLAREQTVSATIPRVAATPKILPASVPAPQLIPAKDRVRWVKMQHVAYAVSIIGM